MDIFLIELSKCASVFGVAFFSFWAAIPLGVGLGLNPIVVIVTVVMSYASGVMLVVFFGDKIRAWVMSRRKKSTADIADDAPKPNQHLLAIWERYGIWGLGLAAPMTVGSQIGAAFGVMMRAPAYRLIIAMVLGALIWGICLTLAVVAGVMGIQAIV
ncbi:MAG: small multi-drug export protein [Phototrophicales bacterium]|nr:small multi-drug export protein [Phototrophicales bacterium]